MTEEQNSVKISRAGIALGLGFAGLFDSFAFHMILQWHHMLSNVIPPNSMENMHRLMTYDGMFDAFNFLVLLIGSFLLWRAAYNRLPIPALPTFIGQLLFGFGLFNLIEGILDHHLLQIHYVRQVPDYAIYNWTFLGVGALVPLVIGWLLMKSGRKAAANM
jgi:uncharacterized membrane protein